MPTYGSGSIPGVKQPLGSLIPQHVRGSSRRVRDVERCRYRKDDSLKSHPSTGADISYSQVNLSTGFPVPITVAPQPPPERLEGVSIPEKEFYARPIEDEFRPVFRVSPYDAERRRKERAPQYAKITFLDEGNTCRSILAEAIFKAALKGSGLERDILVDSASIGPICGNILDARVALVAKRLGIEIGQFKPKVFDEIVDVVDCDLVLTMDRFDYEEVYREVSVLDAINPGGFYCSRMKLLGDFSIASPISTESRQAVEVNDPFYGVWDSEEAQKNLELTVQQLQIATRGLIHYMKLLKPRCLYGLSLQTAVAQSLRCPVIDGSASGRVAKLQSNTWRPVWKNNGSEEGDFFTIRYVDGQRKVVKRTVVTHENGFWSDIDNVEKELLKWMQENDCQDRIPMHKELQATSAWSLSNAITKHGGPTVFAERLSLPPARLRTKKYGYWSNMENVKKELHKWMEKHGKEGQMPKYGELCETGDKNLARVISKHGGSQEFIESMGLEIQKGGKGCWANGRLQSEMHKYCETNENGEVYLPTRETLLSRNRADLYGAMQSFGGARKLAEAMGVSIRKNGYRPFHEVALDIRSVMSCTLGTLVRLPTKVELEEVGRGDLLREIKYYGGFKKFANRAGWVYKCRGHEEASYSTIHRRLAFSLLLWQWKIVSDANLFDFDFSSKEAV
ncbi:hypothetical protein BSKO_13594 [Bryopsis sp. KO-2023]|nr:hypothetical protein BSKO_13594 [Bryopsis sp. KO-2023]